MERDVGRHDLRCQRCLCGLGSASDRRRWRVSDGGSPSARDAGFAGNAFFKRLVIRSDGGDRRPQAALRPCLGWAAARGAAKDAFVIGETLRKDLGNGK